MSAWAPLVLQNVSEHVKSCPLMPERAGKLLNPRFIRRRQLAMQMRLTAPRGFPAAGSAFGAIGSMLFNSVEFLFLFLPLALIFHFCAARFDMRTAVVVTTLTS